MSATTRTPDAAAAPGARGRAARHGLGPGMAAPVLQPRRVRVAWQLIVLVGGYPPFILPGPLTVADRFVRAWADGTMWPHTWATLVEVLLGFGIGAGLRSSWGCCSRDRGSRSGCSAPTW